MTQGEASQASAKDIRESKRRCWCPSCKRTAWLKDWCGWNWCFRHAYRNARWGGGRFWHDVRALRFRWPY